VTSGVRKVPTGVDAGDRGGGSLIGTVTHTCNPGYSGGRDQEDRGSKPAWANSSRDPISKKRPNTKQGWQSDIGSGGSA
jgi:hypothetical protein